VRLSRSLLGSAALGLALLSSKPLLAQQNTFHLDRLEIPGGPDDGIVLFRPVASDQPIFFGQGALGYSLNPLHMRNVTADPTTLRLSDYAAIKNQFTTYFTAGIQILKRATFAATFPATWVENGANPNYGPAFANQSQNTNTFHTDGPAAGDTRLDFRYIAWQSDDKQAALAPQLSIFLPSGTNANFGGDGAIGAMLLISGEYTFRHFITFVANTGYVFRPENSIGDPAHTSGLGIGDEWRWAVGAFIPIKNGKYRLGATVWGQTGVGSDPNIIGSTAFTRQNTPIMYDFEGRMKFGGSEHWWAGADLGSRILPGYGAPDFRALVLLGAYVPILDTNANSPDRREAIRASIRESMKDTDGDGIPDDIDACPTEPEDHKDPDPSDGCPAPSDRDGDGIPDNVDKCPDVPEDKDGIDDQDGCPEDDADNDGIPDAKDACPHEPGQPDPDPKKNGCPKFIKLEQGVVRVLQQVHFQTGSATILSDSFPMLTEVVQLLKANPGIKKMRIEGHTDNVGGAAMNLTLSTNRAASVRTWLVTHGVEAGRLESEGYGLTKPIDTNDTVQGRANNRRVEFKILEEESNTGPAPPPKGPSPPPSPPPQ
jgi:OmpA-OmpF porin, OOP family